MTEKQFVKAYEEFKSKFPDFKNSFIIVETSNELHNASEGDAIQVIKCMIDLADKNPIVHAILLTTGEYLRSELSASEINSLTKAHLERVTKDSVN
jgi:hypothetical protein